MKNPSAPRAVPLRVRLALAALAVIAGTALTFQAARRAPAERAFAIVRSWLLADDALASAVQQRAIPGFAVDLATSPPLADTARAAALADYAALAAAWATARGLRVDASAPRLGLTVRQGDVGVRAELFAADGNLLVRYERTFAPWWPPAAAFALAALLFATARRRVVLAIALANAGLAVFLWWLTAIA